MYIVFTNKDLGDNPNEDELYMDNNFIKIGENRTDPQLIETIEELGEYASRKYGKIKIVEVPDGIKWEIYNYDGIETIIEKGRS